MYKRSNDSSSSSHSSDNSSSKSSKESASSSYKTYNSLMSRYESTEKQKDKEVSYITGVLKSGLDYIGNYNDNQLNISGSVTDVSSVNSHRLVYFNLMFQFSVFLL